MRQAVLSPAEIAIIDNAIAFTLEIDLSILLLEGSKKKRVTKTINDITTGILMSNMFSFFDAKMK
ncbi:hypothetical protein [Priestia megaterium]